MARVQQRQQQQAVQAQQAQAQAQAAPVQPFNYNPQVVAAQAMGILVSKVAMTLVDRVLYPEPRLSDLRDEMMKVIDENEPLVQAVRAKRQTEAAARPSSPPSPPQPSSPPTTRPDVTTYIEQSLQALKQAQEATACSVCKREIGEAAREVERRLNTIRNTDRVYRSMQDLGARGVIQPNAKWSTLTETERELVRQHAMGQHATGE
jgi:hypothetical protein